MTRVKAIRIFGAVVLVIVAVGYGFALWRGGVPGGHPWSGITLTIMGCSLAASRPKGSLREWQLGAGVLAGILAMVAGGLWLSVVL